MPQLDESLLLRIGQGDMEAFAELYRQTDRSVYAFALSILKNREDSQDVMQDTYLKIRTAASGYQAMGKPMAWICTIVKNLALMKLREQKRSIPMELPEEALPAQLQNSFETGGVDGMVLNAALKLLNEEERQIVLLHGVTGMLHREIADILGIPLSTVLSKYRRALAKLRKNLQGGETA